MMAHSVIFKPENSALVRSQGPEDSMPDSGKFKDLYLNSAYTYPCQVSPLESDAFREYRDQEFLDRLGVALNSRPLAEFWPRGGPWWDGLAWTSEGRCVLKANIPEFNSDPSRASPASLHRIQAAFAETKAFLRVRSDTGWSRCFYQYARRITHLHLLGDALRAGGLQPVTASRGRGAWGRGDGCPARRRQPRWRSRPTGIRHPAPAAHGSPTVSGSGQRPRATG